ncbi:MAG: class F sortase [Tepidiformaceae bacterium]
MTQTHAGRHTGAGVRVLRYLAILSFIAGVSIFAGSLAWYFLGDDPAPAAEAPFVPIEIPTRTPTVPSTAEPSPTATPVPYDGAVTRLQIPRFSVDVGIENIGVITVAGGGTQLDTPADVHKVGWYGIDGLSDKPGFGGNAVFAAHVDYFPNIRGPFYELNRMEAGDEIVIVMEDGRAYTYSLIARRSYPADNIPMGDLLDATTVDATKPEGAEWITLVTCGGELVRDYPGGPGHYKDRVVVIAERIS